ncbi:hypothetical protein [Planococcus versutus]|uniref:Lipoprotein n=1 Tax=Planococcus versutus TaxID=1302659 RepID=A0A1B1S1M3_9BACL|nr:hypothetical protein [Planococcus versutus]ANU27091.1 hypothetical protein I858_008815 [Planococcus versutus]
MIKKVMMVSMAALFLTACSDKAPDETTPVPEETNSTQSESADAAATADQGEWASLPEYATIIDQIDDGEYNFETVTDVSEKRILLLSDQDGKEQYKTIFIKPTDRLEIIKIGNDGVGEIFNATLK